MKRILQKLIRYLALTRGKGGGLYRKFCSPSGEEWAMYLKHINFLYAMGEHCFINTNVVFTDPKYVRVGNNVRLTGCTLFGHDGSVNMLNRAYGCKLDHVGKIDIRDNVFIGHGAIVLPGKTIGPNAIIAAGAVVTRDVGENVIVAGVPAKSVMALDEYVQRLKEETSKLPWAPLIERREGDFDPHMQEQLDQMRIQYFFEL